MPPSTTARFGLLKPQVGGDNNQWGATLNQTLDQIDGVLNLTGTTVVADTAARDALFPDPAFDALAIVKSLGVLQRYGTPASGIPQWLATSLTREAGPVVSVQSQGHIGDGISDDAPIINAADLLATVGKGRVEIDPVTAQVMVKSNLTIVNHFRPSKGCKINIAAGTTLIINSEFDPGLWNVFDPASLGVVVFNKIRKFYADWFGVKGDGVTDDAPALNFMIRCIPDNSVVFFESSLNMVWKSEVRRVSRRGIQFISTVPSFPDGGGAQITWMGPEPQRGVDATITANVGDVTFGTPLRRLPNLGERFVLKNQGQNRNGIVTQVISNTHIVVDGYTRDDWGGAHTGAYTLGGIMAADISCDHCDWIGFTWKATNNQLAKYGWNGYITTGTANFFRLTGSSAGGLTGMAGRRFRLIDQVTGLTLYVGNILNVTNDNTCTLTPAYTGPTINSSAPCEFEIGPDAVSLSAVTVLMSDLTSQPPNFATGTRGKFLLNLIVSGGMSTELIGLSFSGSTDSNQEYHIVEWNTISVGALGDYQIGPLSFAAGDVTIHLLSGNSAHDWQIGQVIEIENPGGAIYRGQVQTVPDAATMTVFPAIPFNNVGGGNMGMVGHFWSTCVEIGSSFNCKKIAFRDNIFSQALYGIKALNGSFFSMLDSFSICSTAFYCTWASEICTIIQPNHEACRRFVYKTGATLPLVIIGCRLGSIWSKLHGGHILLGSGGVVHFMGMGVDNVPPKSGTLFEFEVGGRKRVIVTGTLSIPDGMSMASLGFTQAARDGGATIIVRDGIQSITTDVPAEELRIQSEFITSTTGLKAISYTELASTGVEVHCLDTKVFNNGESHGSSAIRAALEGGGAGVGAGWAELCALDVGLFQQSGGNNTQGALAAALIVRLPIGPNVKSTDAGANMHGIHVLSPANVQQVSNDFYGMKIESINQAGFNKTPTAFAQMGLTDLNFLGGITTFGSSRVEKATVYIDIGAGGNATPNAAGAMAYRYRIAGAATINAPLNPVDGMEFEMEIFNNTGGAITPTLNGVFSGSGYGAIGAGKSRTRRWIYDSNAGQVRWKPVGAVSEDF